VLGGTYTDQPIVLDRPLTLSGPEAVAPPVFRTRQDGGAALRADDGASGSVVSHLAIVATGDTTGVEARDAVVLDDLTVRASSGRCLRSDAVGLRIGNSTFATRASRGEPCVQTTGDDTEYDGLVVTAPNAATAAATTGNGRVIDSTFTGHTAGLALDDKIDAHRVTAIGGEHGIVLTGGVIVTDSVAIARDGGSAIFSAVGNHALLNVTAWGEGQNSIGIRATAGAQLTVENSIARGEASDLQADAATPTITGDCKRFSGCPAGQIAVSHSNFVRGTGITDNGMNSARNPRFVNPGSENFHLRRGSRAIDAGSFDFNGGSADRDGRYRWLGKAPDMGAYEYPAPRPARHKTDPVPPRLTGVALAPSRFRVARQGVAFAASGPPRGARLTFHVDEDCDLVLMVSRPQRGARVLGTIISPFGRGRRHIAISGRVNGRALPPGGYVLTVVARDAGQNLSRERHLPFTVVP
jgi:hypothetical protein